MISFGLMASLNGTENMRGKELLVRIFSFVRDIPYRVSEFDSGKNICRESVHVGIKKGDCRHKTLLLYNLLLERNFNVSRVKVIFDWADLPIPNEILGILEKTGTVWSHDAIKLNENEHYFMYIDPTWNVELGEVGFPVTKTWDGEGPTKQVTCGDLEYFDYEGFRNEDHGIFIDKDEAIQFGAALNEWLDSICPIE